MVQLSHYVCCKKILENCYNDFPKSVIMEFLGEVVPSFIQSSCYIYFMSN